LSQQVRFALWTQSIWTPGQTLKRTFHQISANTDKSFNGKGGGESRIKKYAKILSIGQLVLILGQFEGQGVSARAASRKIARPGAKGLMKKYFFPNLV
jgi:hypothetical protein